MRRLAIVTAWILLGCSREGTPLDMTGDGPVEPVPPGASEEPAEPGFDAGNALPPSNPDAPPPSPDMSAGLPGSVAPSVPPEEPSPTSMDAGDAQVPVMSPPGDAGDAGPGGEPVPTPPDERSPECVEALRAFNDEVMAALAVSANLDCLLEDDCVEVDECGGGASCQIGEAMNLEAALAFEAEQNWTCECLREDPLWDICPEPEPPRPHCLEGACAMLSANDSEPLAPLNCEEQAASWARFTSAFDDRSLGVGCNVISVGNGCTDGVCQHYPVSAYRHDHFKALLESHLRFNPCEQCGEELVCEPPAVVEDGFRCVLVE